MRKLGLIGGLSWFSTRSYYEYINRGIQARAGNRFSAPLVIESLDFSNLSRLSDQAEWDRAARELGDSAQRLEAAGATAIIIGANSMHKVFDRVAEQVEVPMMHIAECVGRKMGEAGVAKAVLLGTRNVMVDSFYRQKLIAHDVELLAPEMSVVDTLDRIIYDELVVGKATRQAERELKTIITTSAQDGAQAVVLGCTELEMVVDVDANVLPIFDCTRIHCQAAVDWILGEA